MLSQYSNLSIFDFVKSTFYHELREYTQVFEQANKKLIEERLDLLARIDESRSSELTLYLLDLSSQKYLYMSDNVINITGKDKNYFLNHGLQAFFERMHPDDEDLLIHKLYPVYYEEMAKLSSEDLLNTYASLTFRLQNAEGKYIPVQDGGSAIELASDGKPILMLGAAQRMTSENFNGVMLDISIKSPTGIFKNIFHQKFCKSILTKRELAILELLAKGHESREVAEMLHIDRTTVDTHRRKILKKLQVKNIVEAVYDSRQRGIL